MDLDFNINSLEFSLVKICAVNVVHQLLLASGRALVTLEGRTEVEANATERIKQLNIPENTKEMLEMYVKPINDELDRWYVNHCGFCSLASPVFTPHGTLDLMGTTRAIVEDESIDFCKRFLIACGYCHEQKIFETLDSLDINKLRMLKNARINYLTFVEVLPIELAELWLNYSQNNDGNRIEGRVLPISMCNIGFAAGLSYCSDIAINYFIDKALAEDVPTIFEENFFDQRCLAPSTYCSLFSKLREDQHIFFINIFSYVLLKVLLKWPYQQWFLRAAVKLTDNLNMDMYWAILEKIARKAALGFKDHNYRGLFFAFWKLGDVPRSKTSFFGFIGQDTMLMVCVIGDEKLINLILDDISAKDKQSLLDDYFSNMICSTLLCNKDYKTLELFIRGCGMNRKHLLASFRDSFFANAKPCESGMRCFEVCKRTLELDAWVSEKRNLVAIVNLIISESVPSIP